MSEDNNEQEIPPNTDLEVALIENQDNECPICLLDYDEETRKQIDCPGNHVFHKECIDAWLIRTRKCPFCRVPVTFHHEGQEHNDQNNALVPIPPDVVITHDLEFYGNIHILTDFCIFGNVVWHRIPVVHGICLNSLTITGGNLIIHGNLQVMGAMIINGSLAMC